MTRSRSHAASALVVALVHVGVLLAIGAGMRRIDLGTKPVPQPVLVVRLSFDAPAPAPVPAPAAVESREPRPAVPAVRRPAPVPAAAAISLPGPESSSGVAGITVPADAPRSEPAAGAEAPASAPEKPALDLRLPRGAAAPWRAQNPAVAAQVGRNAPPTLEDRIADAAAQTGAWTEERIDADTLLYRRGHTCVRVHRSRAAQLDPMAPGAQQRPWLAGDPGAVLKAAVAGFARPSRQNASALRSSSLRRTR